MNDAMIGLVTMLAHEAGHAVFAWASPYVSPPEAVRFLPDGGECAARISTTPASLVEALEAAAFCLSGFAGESIAFGGLGRLIGNDLPTAAEIAETALSRFGDLPGSAGSADFIKKLRRIDTRYRSFLGRAYSIARERIQTHHTVHRRLRDALGLAYRRGAAEVNAEALAACLGPRPF